MTDTYLPPVWRGIRSNMPFFSLGLQLEMLLNRDGKPLKKLITLKNLRRGSKDFSFSHVNLGIGAARNWFGSSAFFLKG